MSAITTTICFIDDIQSVVDGVSKQINWERHGITVSGTAINGEDGLMLITSCRPDIIVTDIRMPKLDGLELTRRVKELLPRSKVILMTGFSDFEYARQAVQLGAFDFITKPFSLAHIEEIVVKAKKEIEAIRNQEDHIAELEQRVQESMPFLRQELFTLLLHHKVDKQEAEQRWEYVKPDLESRDLLVMILEIDGFADKHRESPMNEIELARFALKNITEETIALYTKGMVFRDSANRLVAVLNTPLSAPAAVIAEACCQHVRLYTSLTTSIGIGRPVTYIHELYSSYDQALHALSYHFYTGGNAVISYEDIANTEMSLPRSIRTAEQEMVYALQSGNVDQALLTLDHILNEFTDRSPLPKPEYFISLYYELAYMMLRAIQDKVPMNELSDLNMIVREGRVSSERSLTDMKKILHSIVTLGCERIENQNRSAAAQIIQEAIHYVKSNLDQDLSLSACAKGVHLSPSYFAGLFKKVTGMAFSQFVTQERMEVAKRLLLEDRQIQEIAESLGYVERRYFTDVFKKYTQMTPSEFKQAHIRNNISL
ncbi:response regulator [Paenibacillus sp. ISL-20]|uniref:response regulator n=1 Tax=Paenibacillus sp. ISL-20 TaxID=2819163 RepID=UPI001BE9A64D|nr:response regulator [Paenibacillus sp. ISL-20]MBT2763426.1 response regulator [Paenibacillus sp. ISL-20]